MTDQTSTSPPSDRRPALALLAATILLLIVHLLPSPPPIARGDELIALTPPGKTCLAILLFAVTLWVTEAMPFPVTSLLVLILLGPVVFCLGEIQRLVELRLLGVLEGRVRLYDLVGFGIELGGQAGSILVVEGLHESRIIYLQID